MKSRNDEAALALLQEARSRLLDSGQPTVVARKRLGQAHERAGKDAPDLGETPLRMQLLDLCGELERELAVRPEFGTRSAMQLTLLLVASALVGILYWKTWVVVETGTAGRWRAAYSTLIYRDEPIVRRDLDVNFDWADTPPIENFYRDMFTVTWDTCLVTSSLEKMTLHLRSTDRASLHVDGKLVLEMRKGEQAADIDLEPGVHHLRVWFREKRGRASISLQHETADGERLPIAASKLRYPGDKLKTPPCTQEMSP